MTLALMIAATIGILAYSTARMNPQPRRQPVPVPVRARRRR